MTPNFFQAATLKKIWVEATLKRTQVAPYKNMGRFYRVPFKSLHKFTGCRLNGQVFARSLVYSKQGTPGPRIMQFLGLGKSRIN